MKKKLFKGCILLFIPGILFLLIIVSVSSGLLINNASNKESVGSGEILDIENMTIKNKNLSRDVLYYEPIITMYAKEAGIEKYVPILLAIMQVESGGRGGDPMQSSESKGLPPNGITSPNDSIQQGVIHFKNVLQLGQDANLNIFAVIQAYNYGTNYIKYLSQKGLNHNLETAEKYSREVVAPALGNYIGRTYTYINEVSKTAGKTYLYSNGGNFFYAELVNQFLEIETLPTAHILTTKLPLADWSKVVLTSSYGWRNIGDGNEFHDGTDFAYSDGRIDPPIYAIDSGEVMYVGDKETGGGGLTVIIKHSNGLFSYYMHLKSSVVKKGIRVISGQKIGIMGNTGRSTGVHLHLGISRKYWADYLDPMTILKP